MIINNWLDYLIFMVILLILWSVVYRVLGGKK